MRFRTVMLFAFFGLASQAVIIERIAIIVGTRAIKDSDIERAIRITSFLNHEKPDFSLSSRKRAANRLIDQELIRNEIEMGGYQVAPASEADHMLAEIKRERYPNAAQYRRALAEYGIDEPELKNALMWQSTVLHFIETRFRPGVLITDQDIQNYYNAHEQELRREHPKADDVNDVRSGIEQILSGERINQQFYAWLNEQRKDAQIEYREASLE